MPYAATIFPHYEAEPEGCTEHRHTVNSAVHHVLFTRCTDTGFTDPVGGLQEALLYSEGSTGAAHEVGRTVNTHTAQLFQQLHDIHAEHRVIG